MFSSLHTPTTEQSKPGAACSTCRLKKRGCDRVKPVCGPCETRGQGEDCSYPDMSVPRRPDTTSARRESQITARPESQVPACATCRIRHRRCDRIKPVCGTCRGRGAEDQCYWDREDIPIMPRKRPRSPETSTPVVVLHRVSPVQPDSTTRVNGTEPQELSESSSSSSSSSDSSEPAVSSDSYHTAVVPQGTGFSGRKVSLLNRLQKAIYGQLNGVKGEEKGEDGLSLPHNVLSTNGAVQPPSHDGNGQEAPPELSQKMMDRLVHTYLAREYVNLPIFDYEEFQSTYKAATRQGLTTASKSVQGILNTIFSLSGLNAKDLDDAAVESLFNRGYQLTRDMEYSGYALDRVQAYILQSQYFHAIRKPKLAWIPLGHAIRTLQLLDLRRGTDAQDQRRRSPELARRLWHSAMIIERMLALQIGLSPQTSKPLSIPLPTHSDADYLDVISGGEPALSGERPSLVEFHTACARLYSHVEDIMAWESELRLQAETCAAKKLLALEYQAFIKVDGQLHDWNLSLPSFLHPTTTGDLWEDPLVRRQRNILRVRYLYLRLRLFRPLMILGVALCTNCNYRCSHRPQVTPEKLNAPDSPVAWGLARDAIVKCIATASELVDILKANEEGMLDGGPHDGHRSPIPPSWENVDYLYACGLVLLATRLCPFARRRGQDEVAWTGVLDLLKRYQDVRTNGRMKEFARRCRSDLRTLSETAAKPPSNGTASMPTPTAAPIDLDEDPPAAGTEGVAADLPVQPRPLKRRRLKSDIGPHTSLRWIERLANNLFSATE